MQNQMIFLYFLLSPKAVRGTFDVHVGGGGSGIPCPDYHGDFGINMKRILFIGIMLYASAASAGVLVHFTFNDETTTPDATAPNVFSTDMDISHANITFGAVSGFPDPPYAQGSTGWDATTQEAAKNFFFTLTSSAGYTFSVTQVVFRARVTAAGPSAIGFALNGGNLYEQDADANTTYTINESVAGFANLSTATFRIQGWDNDSRDTTGGGQFRIDDVILFGTVHVPEPASMLLSGLGMAFLFVGRRLVLGPRRRRGGHSIPAVNGTGFAVVQRGESYLFDYRRISGIRERQPRGRGRRRRRKIRKPVLL